MNCGVNLFPFLSYCFASLGSYDSYLIDVFFIALSLNSLYVPPIAICMLLVDMCITFNQSFFRINIENFKTLCLDISLKWHVLDPCHRG